MATKSSKPAASPFKSAPAISNTKAGPVVATTTTATTGGFTPVSPVGKVTLPAGGIAPAMSTNAQGPVVAGSAPLTAPTNFTATPQTKRTPVYDENGNVTGYNVTTYNWDGSSNPTTFEAGAAAPAGLTADQKDAWALISASIAQWFGGDAATTAAAADFIKQQMLGNVGPQQALVNMRQQQFYKTRFAGNETRVASGLNALTEAEYLALENQYSNLFNAYGLGPKGGHDLATKSQFATLIGSDVSATELNSRLDLAVNQVQNADPMILDTLQKFYPTVSTTGLLAYFLAPQETLPVLQQQTLAAEIGTAAKQQGLDTDVTSATALAKYGVTQAQAQAGYQKAAEVLPAATKLSDIYGAQGINYNQQTAEKEFLMNQGAAALQRKKLAATEEATFSGKSGLSPNIDALKKSMQGAF